VPADLVRHVDDRARFAGIVERDDPLVVPLADIEPVAVVGEVGTGILGTRDRAAVA
jgi:hypothetical protein